MFTDEASLQELLVVAVFTHGLGLDAVGGPLAQLHPTLAAHEALPVVVLLPEPQPLPQDHLLTVGALLAELLHVADLAVVLAVLAAVHLVQLDGAVEAGETFLVKLFTINNQLYI